MGHTRGFSVSSGPTQKRKDSEVNCFKCRYLTRHMKTVIISHAIDIKMMNATFRYFLAPSLSNPLHMCT